MVTNIQEFTLGWGEPSFRLMNWMDDQGESSDVLILMTTPSECHDVFCHYLSVNELTIIASDRHAVYLYNLLL
jgi:hypothetical protein